MKKYIYKISLLLACGVMSVSCIHDKIDDLASIGKKTPTAYWEQVPGTAKAGDNVPFELQYYPMDGKSIKNLEVWYKTTKQTTFSASCPLLSTFKYEVTGDTTELVREYLRIEDYSHSQDLWSDSKRAFALNGSFPTTYTLREVEWANVEDFDQKKFDTFFPKGFGKAFQDSIFSKLKVDDYKKILTITNPRMEPEEFDKHVGFYIDENVGKVTYIKPESQPMMTELFYSIPVDSLFYDSNTSTFKLEYLRVHSLGAKFMVTDSEGAVGRSEEKTIKLR